METEKDLLHPDNEVQLQNLDFVCSQDITDEFNEQDIEFYNVNG